MPELLAEGPDPRFHWKYPLTAQAIKLGRKSPESDWACPWDAKISRFHATLTWRNGKLHVQRKEGSLNPIYWRGQVADDFEIAVGEQFVIGGTTFTLQETEVFPASPELPTPIDLTGGPDEVHGQVIAALSAA